MPLHVPPPLLFALMLARFGTCMISTLLLLIHNPVFSLICSFGRITMCVLSLEYCAIFVVWIPLLLTSKILAGLILYYYPELILYYYPDFEYIAMVLHGHQSWRC